MPTLALYEHCTATNLGRLPGNASHGLWREGKLMRDALADDFRAAGWAVTLAEPKSVRQFAEVAGGHDATIIIAPEFGSRLGELVHEARTRGAAVWAGESRAIEDCTFKRYTFQRLASAGVPTPRLLTRASDEWPRVLKPDDGAGSTDTHLVFGPVALRELLRADPVRNHYCSQEYVPGVAASAAFLIGPGGTISLPACYQFLSGDGRFHYLGGETPVDPTLAAQAESLARRAVSAIPGLAGFVGVDLVLGERDVVIEINPRLCTSYLGLRQLCRGNLAAAWAAVATGHAAPELHWHPGPVRWSVDG